MRLTVNRGFTPRRIAKWEDRVREISEECVRGAENEDCFDVVDKLAAPLPMRIIAEMLGVDTDRIADFRRWSTGAIDAVSGSGRASSPGYALRMAGELFQYMRTVADARRKHGRHIIFSDVLFKPVECFVFHQSLLQRLCDSRRDWCPTVVAVGVSCDSNEVVGVTGCDFRK